MKTTLLGTEIFPLRSNAIPSLFEKQGRLVSCANTHVLTLAWEKPEFKTQLEKFHFILPDGRPLKFLIPHTDQIRGELLMHETLLAFPKKKHFLLGGTKKQVNAIQSLYPFTNFCGEFTDSIPKEEQAGLNSIETLQPDFVWVSLGCPKQETWIANHAPKFPNTHFIAVGYAFSLLSKEKKRAPQIIQTLGLEWLHRIFQQPNLFQRYLKYNFLFLFALTSEFLCNSQPHSKES